MTKGPRLTLLRMKEQGIRSRAKVAQANLQEPLKVVSVFDYTGGPTRT